MALSITTLYYDECHYAECYIVFFVMLSVIMLSVIMLSVIMLSVIMLSVIMLSVVMLSVAMLSVMAPLTFHVKCFLALAKKGIKHFGEKNLDKLECFTQKYIYNLVQCMLARCTPKWVERQKCSQALSTKIGLLWKNISRLNGLAYYTYV